MANEVKKLYEMGITTPQTKLYLAKKNEKEPIKAMTVEQEPMTPLRCIGGIRYNECGEMVQPPVKPEEPKPIDQSNWKRITPKRREQLAQYRRDKEDYEVALIEYERAMSEWLKLPTDDRSKMEVIIEEYEKRDKILRNDEKIVLFNVLPKPYKPIYKMEILEVREEIQTGFGGHASQERRRYKRNRDLDMDTEYDTDIETGERRQQTLFNCRTSDKGSRIVDYEYIHRFEAKPNVFLSRMYLDYILNGVPINDWYKAQINKWIKNARVSGYQSTL